MPYEEQARLEAESLTGLASLYVRNLRKCGCDASAVFANNEVMQKTWAREHSVKLGSDWRWQVRLRGGLVPWVSRSRDRWVYDILRAQVRHYEPDVLVNLAMDRIAPDFLRDIRPSIALLVGQHAATRLSETVDFSCYGLVLSSFPPTVDWFRGKGLRVELLRLGFEPQVARRLVVREAQYDVTFVGGFESPHRSRVEFLEELCELVPSLAIWAPTVERLSSRSLIRERHAGQAWGDEMFQVLRDSRITLNHHGDVLPYANNKRLYEATGVGTLLLTDWKENLPEMFVPGKEAACYRDARECASLVEHYLCHEEERKSVARAGQQRTLRDHTYGQRMHQLAGTVRRLLSHTHGGEVRAGT